MAEYSHYIIKYVFATEKFGGVIIIIGDTKAERIEKIDYVVYGKNATPERLNSLSSMKADEILKVIAESRSNVSNTVFYDHNQILKNYFGKYPEGRVKRIGSIIMTTGEEYLRNVLLKSLFDEDVAKILHADLTGSEMYAEVIFHRETEPETKIETNEILLKSEAKISPAGGIRAIDIKEGMDLYIKITDDSPIGKHLSKTLAENDGEEEGTYIIAPVIDKEKITISKYRESSDMCEIYVVLGEDIYGQITVQPDVKIKIAENIFEQEEQEIVSKFEKNQDGPVVVSATPRSQKNSADNEKDAAVTDTEAGPENTDGNMMVVLTVFLTLMTLVGFMVLMSQ